MVEAPEKVSESVTDTIMIEETQVVEQVTPEKVSEPVTDTIMTPEPVTVAVAATVARATSKWGKKR